MQAQQFAYLWLEPGAHGAPDRLHTMTPQHHFWREVPAPPEAGSLLADLIDPHFREVLVGLCLQCAQWRLILDRSMPETWHFAPWESLVLDGKLISSHALVCRMANPKFQADGAGYEPRPDRSGWLNLFPKHEFDFARAVQGAKRFPNKISRRWASREVESCDELFLLSHGGPNGLLDDEGKPDSLEDLPLPKRIWLLACNEDGALYRTAVGLLATGARTVITSTGTLEASEIANVLRNWMDRGDPESLDAWLSRMRVEAPQDGGARGLTIFGDVTIDANDLAGWNERTLRAAMRPESCLTEIRDNVEDFSAAIKVWEAPSIWPLTAEWMLPELLRLSENHDHGWMLQLERLASGARRTASVLLALANSAYRSGYYYLAAQFAMDALDDGRASPVEFARLHGVMANVGIDVNLPELAERAVEAHQLIPLEGINKAREQDHRRIDWLARIALRKKQFSTALRLMRAKRRENLDSGETRELAWLIYINAWACRHGGTAATETRQWLDEAITAVESRHRASTGNDPDAYLLRALACHAWACGEEGVRETVVSSLDRIHAGLDQIDPGPWAFALSYLGLITGDSEAIETGVCTLETKRYFLEAAAFSTLGGLETKAEENTRRFTSQQEQVVRAVEQSSSYSNLVIRRTGLRALADCIPC